MTNTDSSKNVHAFDPALALYLLMVALMAGAVAYSVSIYLGWLVAVPIGIALTYCFSRLIQIVVAPAGDVSWVRRVGCGAAALCVFGATMGLSYSTLYAKFFAQTSALDYFHKTRLPVQRQLEHLVGNAETARKSFAAWDAHSKAKAIQEAKNGGTCPAKAASPKERGPIAMFRESEAGIAANLHSDIKASVDALSAKLNGVKEIKPKDFADVLRLTAELNATIEAGETLAHGSFVKSTMATLQRQLDTQIEWPKKEVFFCGDAARDESLKQALSALTALEQLPSLKPMAPPIDLSVPQIVANRGLLRSFNSLAYIFSFGLIGQFDDDPLMKEALKKGLINQETLGMFTASLLELCVLLTAAMASRRGSVPFPVQPNMALMAWQKMAESEGHSATKFLHLAALWVVKGMFNLFWTQQSTASDSTGGTATLKRKPLTFSVDPAYPPREMAWAISLAPYLVSMHDADYVCIPAEESPHSSLAARTLHFLGAATILHSQVPWKVIARNPIAARQLRKLRADAENFCYEVFKLEPTFAQALRLKLLSGGTAAS